MAAQASLLTGQQLIGYSAVEGASSTLHGVDPASGARLPISFSAATPEQVDAACTLTLK